MHCPPSPFPPLPNDNHDLEIIQHLEKHEPHGYVDSDLAADTKTRKSTTGLAIILAGGPIAYKTKSQATISHSTTEAEFTAATDCAKTALYIRSILKELGLRCENPTTIYEDNAAAIEMANAQKPTRRTRHMDIKHFALLQWCETDQIILSAISTSDNAADGMTKPLATTLFNRHRATLLGHRAPTYINYTIHIPG